MPAKERIIGSKIAADYVERTLASLLPSAHEVDTLALDEIVLLSKRAAELKKLITKEPVKFYRPNPGGQREFMSWHDPDTRVLMFLAGNKSGKTTAGAIKMAEAMTGEMLWGHDWRPALAQRVPRYGCVFAEDFDSHTEVTLPSYLSWCPRRFIKNIVRNPAGHVVRIEHHNGSILYFRTYDQGSEKAEGKDWHIVWCDEPPPRNVYTSVFRGLVTLDGLLLITATLLKETWLFDEADKSFVKIFQSTIYDNPWISDRAREDLVSTLDSSEADVRIYGKPIGLSGVIYKEFVDGEPFIVPDRTYPVDWPIVMGVDPHERKPCFHLWATLTPDNDIIIFHYQLIKGTTVEIKESIDEFNSTLWRPISVVVMDPNRGKARQLDQRSWEDTYYGWGYQVFFGDDNLRIGHTTVHTFLQSKPPRLVFTESCRGKGGPVHSMQRYAWDDWARTRGYKERTLKEKPKETHKDWCDIIRYLCMADLDAKALRIGVQVRTLADVANYNRFGQRVYG